MLWILLALASAFLLGLYDTAKKTAVDGNAVLPTLFACSAAGLVAIVPLAISPLLSARFAEWSLPALSWTQHGMVVAKSLLVTGSWAFSFHALRSLPVTIAAPVRATSPLFTVLAAVALFGERPNLLQWGGVALILASYIALSRAGRREGIDFLANRAVWALLAGTVLGSASGLYDKHLLQVARIAPWPLQFWFTAYNTGIQGLLLIAASARFARNPAGRQTSPLAATGHPFSWRWSIPAVGILLLLADAAYFRALAIPGALVGIVSSLRRSNVVVSFALGTLLLREANWRAKIWPIAGILAGIALLLA